VGVGWGQRPGWLAGGPLGWLVGAPVGWSPLAPCDVVGPPVGWAEVSGPVGWSVGFSGEADGRAAGTRSSKLVT
jgi:hypothetical protein